MTTFADLMSALAQPENYEFRLRNGELFIQPVANTEPPSADPPAL